jgi:DNA-binding NarL/FixJ family response regulator
MTMDVRKRPVRVVVIDDTPDIRDLLTIVLTRSGVEVVGLAGDGRAGVDVVRVERPDVVVLDLAMPVMDGVEALPLIRGLVPDARIIVHSAYDGRVCEQVLHRGADLFLVKGTPLKQIVSHVEGTAVPGRAAPGRMAGWPPLSIPPSPTG